MPASKLPRPLRRAARWMDTTAYEVTETAQINALPDEPLDSKSRLPDAANTCRHRASSSPAQTNAATRSAAKNVL